MMEMSYTMLVSLAVATLIQSQVMARMFRDGQEGVSRGIEQGWDS